MSWFLRILTLRDGKEDIPVNKSFYTIFLSFQQVNCICSAMSYQFLNKTMIIRSTFSLCLNCQNHLYTFTSSIQSIYTISSIKITFLRSILKPLYTPKPILTTPITTITAYPNYHQKSDQFPSSIHNTPPIILFIPLKYHQFLSNLTQPSRNAVLWYDRFSRNGFIYQEQSWFGFGFGFGFMTLI